MISTERCSEIPPKQHIQNRTKFIYGKKQFQGGKDYYRGQKMKITESLQNTYHSIQHVPRIQKMYSLTYLRLTVFELQPKRCAVSMVTIKRPGDGYHGNGASDMVETILFLKCYDKSNNLRSFLMKSGHFYFFDPCRGQNLTFDLFGCNQNTS